MTLQEMERHSGGGLDYVPYDIRKRIWELMPRYLWITAETRRRRRYFHCEACEREWAEVPEKGRYALTYRAGELTACPYCGEGVIPKYVGKGYGNVNDRMNVTWYAKSCVNPEVILIFGAHCRRQFNRDTDPWRQEPIIDVRSACAIIPKLGARKIKKTVLDWTINGRLEPARVEWVSVRRVGRMTFGDSSVFGLQGPDRIDMVETLEKALKGTAIGRAWHAGLAGCDDDCVRALDLLARYPCCEYLTKLGMAEIIFDKLEGRLPSELVNLRGKKLTDVLKLTPQRWGELKHAGITPTTELLTIYRWLDRRGFHLTATAADSLSVICRRGGFAMGFDKALDDLLKIHPETRRQKVLKYITRQAERYRDTRLHLGDFRDYWNLCVRFGEDIRSDAVAFPGNIREAEARLQDRAQREEQIEKERQNKELRASQDMKIAKALPKLERMFGFSFGGLTLRPASNGDEVRREGQELNHCVGGYVGRYAEGSTVICVLRRDVDPDRPWRTVEINPNTGKLIQDRGYRNDSSMGVPLTDGYKAALDMFWEAWQERDNDRRGVKTA